MKTAKIEHVRRHVRLTGASKMIALMLTEIGCRQRAGMLPTMDGRYVRGLPDEKCIASLRQNYGS